MNIFATDPCPVASAQALDDSRVRKMTVETAQIICTVLHMRNEPAPYKPTHRNHPLTLWAAERPGNLYWLWRHGMALGAECEYRFDKGHKSFDVIQRLPVDLNMNCSPNVNCASNKAFDLDFKHLPVHEAYRTYLNARWPLDKRRPLWTKRGPPSWAKSEALRFFR